MWMFIVGFVLGTLSSWVVMSIFVLSGRCDSGNEVAWARFQTRRLCNDLQRIADSTADSRVANCLRQADAIAKQLA